MPAFTYLSKAMSARLKGLLIGAGHTTESFARQMGLSRATLSHRINGKSDFTKSEMEAFARIVQQDPQQIFFAQEVT